MLSNKRVFKAHDGAKCALRVGRSVYHQAFEDAYRRERLLLEAASKIAGLPRYDPHVQRRLSESCACGERRRFFPSSRSGGAKNGGAI